MSSPTLTSALEETLSLFEEMITPQTTAEVADRLGLGRRSAYDRLSRLVEQGELDTKKVGGNGRVWWRPPESETNRSEVAAVQSSADGVFDDIFERISDGFYALDEEFRFRYLNDHAAEVLGLDESVIGKKLFDVVAVTDAFEQALYEARKTQESVVFEDYYDPVDSWFYNALYPSENGLSVYFRNITDRKQREQELTRFEALIEKSRDVNVILNADGTYQYVPPSMEREFGHDPESLIGENAFEYVHPGDRERTLEELWKALEDHSREPKAEYRFQRGDGSWAVVESRVRNLLDDPEIEGLVIYSRDITDRKEREQELQETKTQLEAATEAGEIGTWEWHIPDDTLVADNWFAKTFGVDPAVASEGVPIAEFMSSVHDDDRDRVEAKVESTLSSCDEYEAEYRVWDAEGELRWVVARGRINCEEDGTPRTLLGSVIDVTERKQRERKLKQFKRRHEAILENFPNGAVALVDEDFRYLTFGGTPEGTPELTREELEGSLLSDILSKELVEFVLPHYEAAFDGEPTTFEGRIRDKLYQFRFAPVRDDDGEISAAMCMSQEITERKKRKGELERQREQLAALNNLNETIRDITEAVIEQSTREEIEQIVCDRLAEADSYEFAWIGDINIPTQTVNVRAAAGSNGCLDDVDISADPEDDCCHGATVSALQTGEIQTAKCRTENSAHPLWQTTQTDNIRSMAAIPLVSEGTVYGVLNVYSKRPKAFEREEQKVSGQLGEVIGHAIAAAERKRALLSDEVVELKFQLRNVFDTLDIDVSTTGTASIDYIVPVEADEFLAYGTVTENAIESVTALVETLPHWSEVTFRETPAETTFELRLIEPPVLTKVTALGGSIEHALIDDGDYQMTVHLAPGVNIRQIIDEVQTAYPTIELLKRHQTTREAAASQSRAEITATLTERQETVLEAAVYAGYFEWPRDASGEDIADSLDIAPPTFANHLRKAQKKIFESLYLDG